MIRLIERSHHLTEIAGVRHTYMYILFGVQVLRMRAAIFVLYVNALMLMLRRVIVRTMLRRQELGEVRGSGWYAQLCTTLGRHVYLLCSPVMTCAFLTARLLDDGLANTHMLHQARGVDRLVWNRRELGELGGFGNMSCITGRNRTGIDSVQRGLLYHQLDHPLNHRLGCRRPYQLDHPLNHHLGCRCPHQLDHRRLCLLLGAGVPMDRQAPRSRDRCKSGTGQDVTERAECLALGTLAKERDPNGARGNNELHLAFRGVDPAPRRGRNVRQ